MRRRVTDEERKLFEQDFREGRPIKPVIPKAGTKAKGRVSGPSGINGATEDRLRRWSPVCAPPMCGMAVAARCMSI